MSKILKIQSFILKHLGTLLFAVFLLLGTYNLFQFGIAWDEDAQIRIGEVSYNYVFLNDKGIQDFFGKDYGVVIELPLVIIDRLFDFENSREKFLLRHFLTHLFFLITALYCYKLILKLYKNKGLALCGFLLLMLNPRMYEESFVNTKDIPFMGMFFVCFYYMVNALESDQIKRTVYFGISLGLLIALRIMGVMLLAVSIGFITMDIIIHKRIKINMLKILALVGLVICTTFVAWPYLWMNPVENFVKAFTNMSKFRWIGNNLLDGVQIPSNELPWTYIPKWFVITVPLLYLVLGAIGIVLIMVTAIIHPIKTLKEPLIRNNFIFLACFFLPLIAVVYFHSVLYDTWRHVYFIYAPFIMLFIYALNTLINTKFGKTIWVIVVVFFIYIAMRMVQMHPFENVYFNALVRKKEKNYIRKNYEMDYWGLSYLQSLQYLLRYDKSELLFIAYENDPCAFNTNLLTQNEKQRIRLVKKEEAKYFITNFRGHPEDYQAYTLIHEVVADNNTINAIYQLHP